MMALVATGLAVAQTTPPKLEIEVERPQIGTPLFEEDFEGDLKGRSPYAKDSYERWQVKEGTVNIPRSPNRKIGGYVDLGGYTRIPGTFETRFPVLFLPNVRYAISFDYFSPNGKANAAHVRIDGHSVRIASSSRTPRHLVGTFEFTEATQAKLIFKGLGNENSGLGIDNIKVTPIAEKG